MNDPFGSRVLLLSLCLCGMPADAALGSRATALPDTTASRLTSELGYAVSESLLASGTRVREFIRDDGIVFAITWQGPQKPDLPLLLGSAWSRYLAELDSRPGGRGASPAYNDGDLLIQQSGHAGAFSGKALRQSLLPAGFDPARIR